MRTIAIVVTAFLIAFVNYSCKEKLIDDSGLFEQGIFVEVVDEQRKPIPNAGLTFPPFLSDDTRSVPALLQDSTIYALPNPFSSNVSLMFLLKSKSDVLVKIVRYGDDRLLFEKRLDLANPGLHAISIEIESVIDSIRQLMSSPLGSGRNNSSGLYKVLVETNSDTLSTPILLFDPQSPTFVTNAKGSRKIGFENVPMPKEVLFRNDITGRQLGAYTYGQKIGLVCSLDGYQTDTTFVQVTGIQDVKFILKKI